MTANGTDSSFEHQVAVSDLPMTFKVKYIGCEIARGLWGIKYTRRPVDVMVGIAKALPPNKVLPQCDLIVSTDGVDIQMSTSSSLSPKNSITNWKYAIDTISYGVQDLVYTRVFAMIVVKEDKRNPFEVHAFVCDSRLIARKLTFALAAAFQDYSRKVKETTATSTNHKTATTAATESSTDSITPTRKKFAIDLRTPEEMQQCLDEETEA